MKRWFNLKIKAKEFSIIFLLTFIILLVSGWVCLDFMPTFGKGEFTCGWPIPISFRMKQFNYYDFECLGWLSFLLNFFFWFMILSGGWWVIKKLRKFP